MEVQAAAAGARHLCGVTTCQAGNWVEGLTPADIREKQLEDPPINIMIHWKEEEVSLKPLWADVAPMDRDTKTLWGQWELLDVVEGVLCRQYVSLARGGGQPQWQLVVPNSIKDD